MDYKMDYIDFYTQKYMHEMSLHIKQNSEGGIAMFCNGNPPPLKKASDSYVAKLIK